MVLKTVSNSIEDFISYESRESIFGSDKLTNTFFTIGVISFFSDLSFTALIFYYLMKSVAGEQEIYDELMDQGQSKDGVNSGAINESYEYQDQQHPSH